LNTEIHCATGAVTAGKTRAGAFQYAQAFPYTRGFTDDFFWRHPGLYRAYGGGTESLSTQRQRTSYLMQTSPSGVPQGYAQTAFSTASGQGAFLGGGSVPVDPSTNIVLQVRAQRVQCMQFIDSYLRTLGARLRERLGSTITRQDHLCTKTQSALSRGANLQGT
jgi:hypothetical protein